ncbi:AAA family ATPase [Roseibium aggregatum]|uniref:AAA family ATPase n=1 Tax=Roseibium aggregatum TaxID=187304 RepID=UPI001E42F4B1|nr:AAA family ATPase [Roseibium aggregatum]UES42274.1 AAA family ATPase [Roseibium aggregatum]
MSRVAELKERLSSGLLNIEQSKNVKAEIENLQQEVRDLWFDRAYFARLSWALQDVKDDYDIVVCDTAPNLGYVTNAAMFAADHLVVTIHPQWLDCESMAQYLYTYLRQQQEFEQAMTSISGANYEVAKSLHYLITRHDTNSSPEALVIGMLRNHLSNVLHNVMVKSSAIAEAGTYQQSLYEADRGRFTRKTFERVMEAMKAVNQEIEHIITSSWGRK